MSGHEQGRAVLADRRVSSDRRKNNFPIPNADPGIRGRSRGWPRSSARAGGRRPVRRRAAGRRAPPGRPGAGAAGALAGDLRAYADHDSFQERTAALVGRAARRRGFLRAYLDELIQREEAEPGDGLVSRQIAKRRAGGDTDRAGMVSTAFLLLVAGHETTANMISALRLARSVADIPFKSGAGGYGVYELPVTW
ncbi:cytochrome P450 family protein [Actinokineospora pegani]|uniref:hypothetical protein n=1 Tax=Actinokineospora pegani TaxID=2654637 RepID=UPI0012EA4D71|nr:hypothetical protein [Actinokineospora pegani]